MFWFIYDSLRVWAWMKCVGSLVNLDQARPLGSRPANINAIMNDHHHHVGGGEDGGGNEV